MARKRKRTLRRKGMDAAWKHPKTLVVGLISIVGALFIMFMINASATNDCSFTDKSNTRILNGNCTTNETIFIPDGVTLDGRNHTITAVDPDGGHFKGAVVQNEGSVAHVKNLKVTASNLSNVCDAGDDRLRGIMFEGASGSITHNTVVGINQGASGCQEGNAIEVRNAPFDGEHPDTKTVEIAHNNIDDYQKTGIVCNGDVDCDIHNNKVGSADLPTSLAANSIQVGFGGTGDVVLNQVDGNQWCGPSDFVATAILLFETGTSDVSKNIIGGNSDVGIYGLTNNTTINNNKVSDSGEDCNVNDYDIGIGDYDLYTSDPGNNNIVTNNKVSGFDTLYDEVTGGKNKAPGTGSPKGNPWF